MSSNIKLIYAGEKSNDNGNDDHHVLKEYIINGNERGNNKEIIMDFYNGKANEKEIKELLLSSQKKNIIDSCIHQECILGYVKDNNEDIVAIINKKGNIDRLEKTDMLSPLFELHSNKKHNKDPEPIEENEVMNMEKKHSTMKKLSDKFDKNLKMSLKKLKSTMTLQSANDIDKKLIIGQIIDSSHKHTKGFIVKDQKLILVKPSPILKDIPIYAVLTTK